MELDNDELLPELEVSSEEFDNSITSVKNTTKRRKSNIHSKDEDGYGEDFDTRAGYGDSLTVYLREIRQIPMQRENHERWGQEILSGQMALNVLRQLSQSEHLPHPQKEKINEVLAKGKFLLGRLDSRMRSAKKE